MLEIETPRNYQKIDEDSSQIQINPLKVVIESKLKKDNKSCQFSENFFFNPSKTEKSSKTSNRTLSTKTKSSSFISSTLNTISLDSSSKNIFVQKPSLFQKRMLASPYEKSIKEKLKEEKKKFLEIYNSVVSPIKPILFKMDLIKFIMSPLIEDKMLICDLKITKAGLSLPKFSLCINTNQLLIMKAEKNFKLCFVEYKIYVIIQNNRHYIGKIKSNMFRNKFSFFDRDTLKKHSKFQYLTPVVKTFLQKHHNLGTINFNESVLCCKSRKRISTMQIHLPHNTSKEYFSYTIQKEDQSSVCDSSADTRRIISNRENNYEVKTLRPMWSEHYSSYYMNFTNRVRLPSKSNFILTLGKINILQFGKIDNTSYALDFQYPLSLFQAFCICVSSIIAKHYYLL